MTREEMDLGPDVTRDEEIAAEDALHQMARSLRVETLLDAIRANRPILIGVDAMRQEVNHAFGRKVV